MALNFPTSPATNTEYTLESKTWVYNGFAWDLKTSAPTISITTASTSAEILDSFSSTAYRTAKYYIQAVKNSNVHSLEMLITHDGTNVYATVFAEIYDTSSLFTVNSYITSGTLNVSVQSVLAGTTIKASKVLIPL